MSSVEEKSKRVSGGIFTRKASIDKIKCTACTAIGSIFSKKSSLIHTLENAMNSSRTIVQMPALAIVIPCVHAVCVAMALLLGLIRRHFSREMSFEHLDKFIIELNQLKAERRQSLQRQQQQKATDKPPLSSAAAVAKAAEEKEEINSRSSAHSHELHRAVFHNDAERATDKRRDNLLTAASFASIALVYVQLSLLLYMASVSVLKLGLLFMLICVAAVGYFTLKISFTTKSERRRSGGSSKRVKSVRQQLIGKALVLRPIKFFLPQIFFNSCNAEKTSPMKLKSS